MTDFEHICVAEAMHRGVIACAPASSGLTVARVMAAHRIHCVVVRPPEGVPRLVTDAAIAGAMYEGRLEAATAAELAQASPLLRPDDTVAFAVERMHENGMTHAIVVGAATRLIGVVSVLDLVECALRPLP